MKLPKLKTFFFLLLGFFLGFFPITLTTHNLSLTTIKSVFAADFIFGTDSITGDFIIKERGGDVKLRIDSTGSLVAPLKYSPSGENLAQNGGFEMDVQNLGTTNPNPLNWRKNFHYQGSSNTIYYYVTSTDMREGSKSMLITTASTADGTSLASDAFPVIPGKTYTVTVDAKSSTALGGFYVRLFLYAADETIDATHGNPSNADFNAPPGYTFMSVVSNATTGTSWATYPTTSNDVTILSGNSCAGDTKPCTRARVAIYSWGVAGTRHIDNVKVITAGTGGTISSANVSSGTFGSNIGGGNYTFPVSLTVTSGLTVSGGTVSLPANQIGSTEVGFNYAGSSSKGGAATTATALASNPSNCSAGNFPLGIDASGNVESCSPTTSSQWTTSGSNIYYNTGNVGIGTTSPNIGSYPSGNTLLTIKGTGSAASSGRLELASQGTVTSDDTGLASIDFINNANKVGYIQAVTEGTGGTAGHILIMPTSGNVGIGTTDPGTYKLYVNGTQFINGRLTLTNDEDIFGIDQLVGYNDLRFYADNAGTTELMRLSSTGGLSLGNAYVGTNPGAGNMIITGNVGIGTTGPATKVDITGSGGVRYVGAISSNDFSGGDPGRPSSGFQLQSGSDQGGLVLKDQGSGVTDTILYYGNDGNDNLRIMHATWGGSYETLNDRMIITGGGNVGIGTTGPGEKLTVSGNSLVTGNTYIGSTDSYFYRDAADRIATPDQFYVQEASANTYLYSTNTYLGSSSGDTIHTRGNTVNLGSTAEPTNTNIYTDTDESIKFFYTDGTTATQIGDIGGEETGWLRINQDTAKNIYTPRYIRADGGFYLGDDERIYRNAEDVIRTPGSLVVDSNLEVDTVINSPYGGIGRYQNQIGQSEAFNWNIVGTLTVTADSTTAPNGETTADTLTAGTSGAYTYWSTGVVVSGQTFTFSVWAKTSSGTQNFTMGVAECGYDGGAGTNYTATTTWQRFSITRSSWTNGAGTACPILYPGTNGGTGTIIAWGAQNEQSVTTAGTYVKTTGTAISTASNGVVASSATGNSLFYGNVGIGTTVPGAKFTVVKADNGTDAIASFYPANLTQGTRLTYRGLETIAGVMYIDAFTNQNIVMQTQSSGNVGIGTTTPGAKLDVNGRILISAAQDTGGNLRFSAANPYIYASSYFIAPGGAYFNSGTVYTEAQIQARGGVADDGGVLELNDDVNIGAGDLYVVNSSGNVGIGTTGPADKLDVSGNIRVTGANYLVFPTAVDVSGSGGGNIQIGGTGAVGLHIDDNEIQTWSDGLHFQIDSGQFVRTYYATYLATTSGNVGIGTTNPGYKLDVNGSSRVAAAGSQTWLSRQVYMPSGGGTNNLSIVFKNSVDANGGIFELLGNDNMTFKNLTSGKLMEFNTNSGQIQFSVDGGANSAVVINTSGNVGIGTTGPGYSFHLHDGTNRNLYLESDAWGGTTGMAMVSANDANNSYMPLTFMASTFNFGSGNVGIGTTGPEAKLDVAGEIRQSACPSGTTKVYNNLCIDSSNRASATGRTALLTCVQAGGHLCRHDELIATCTALGSATVTTGSWMNEQTGDDAMLTVNNASPCLNIDNIPADPVTVSRVYRCCYGIGR